MKLKLSKERLKEVKKLRNDVLYGNFFISGKLIDCSVKGRMHINEVCIASLMNTHEDPNTVYQLIVGNKICDVTADIIQDLHNKIFATTQEIFKAYAEAINFDFPEDNDIFDLTKDKDRCILITSKFISCLKQKLKDNEKLALPYHIG